MKRFSFSLEKVLGVREIRKRLSEEAFLLAARQHRQAGRNLARAMDIYRSSQEEIANSLEGFLDPLLVRERIAYREWAGNERETRKEELKRAEKELSSRRKDLLVRTREEKALSNLKEQRLLEFKEAYFWEQGKVLDEIGVLRYIRRRKGGEEQL